MSRRACLAGVAGGLAVAGCLGGGPRYVFETSREADNLGAVVDGYLRPPPTELSANFFLPYPAADRRSLAETLLTDGRVETLQYQYTTTLPFGTERRSRPRFARHDGEYYRIRQASRREVPTELRALYVEPGVDPPAGATTLSVPPTELSETDARIVEHALEAVAPVGREPLDPDELGFPYRGVLFHDRFDPAETALLPSPPFDYLERDGDQFAVHVERGTVTLDGFTYTAEPVADSRAALETYVAREVAAAQLAPAEVPAAAAEVLATATDDRENRRHTESAPFSEGLDWLVDALGLRSALPEDPAETAFDGVLFAYDGRWLTAELTTR